jgi:hypothetical protein
MGREDTHRPASKQDQLDRYIAAESQSGKSPGQVSLENRIPPMTITGTNTVNGHLKSNRVATVFT